MIRNLFSTNTQLLAMLAAIVTFGTLAMPVFGQNSVDNSSNRKEVKTYFDDEQNQVKEIFYVVDGSDQKIGEYTKYHFDGEIVIVGQHDRRGLKTGVWRYFHSNGVPSASGSFENDTVTGKWTYRHRNGAVSSVGTFQKGAKHGHWESFGEDGVKTGFGDFKDGRGYFYDLYPDGSTFRKTSYHNENRNGEAILYYPDGTIKQVANFTNNVLTDSVISFHENGTTESRGFFLEGEPEGLRTEYFSNGNIASETYYKSSKIDGFRKTYHETGGVKSLIEYKAGLMHGNAEVFYEGGELRSKGKYVFGNPDGVWHEYDEMGTVVKSMTFKDGREIKE